MKKLLLSQFGLTVPSSREYREAALLVKELREKGNTAYIVGGAVRDLLLGKSPKDYDVTTSATPEELALLYPDALSLGAAFGVMSIPRGEKLFIETATYREDQDYQDGRRPEKVLYSKTPQEDVSRRDFTVNALLFDPETEEILDYTSGVQDLKKGVLQTVGDPHKRFREDALRMLRAVRFSVRLDMEMENGCKDAIRLLAPLVKKLSGERIREELDKMLTGPRPEKAVKMLSDLGILKEILPDVEAMRGVEQPEEFHPEGDVFTHTLLMLSHMVNPSVELAWSVLLHDVGKPLTRRVIDGRARFYSHEVKGGEMAQKIMTDLKMPAKRIRRVREAVEKHMRFSHVEKMRSSTWRRILGEEDFPLHLELHRLDCISCHAFMENYLHLLDRALLLKKENASALPPPFLTGKDLILLGLSPSPQLGKLLQEMLDLQLEGKIRNKAHAKEIAGRKIGKIKRCRE